MKFVPIISIVLSLALAAPNQVLGEESTGGIEEIIVTAQRTAENIQDVPIAVTAITGEMLEEKQVITVSDLQMHAPNVSFTATNFGSNSFSIRGIGRLVTAATGDAGVSIHTNDISIAPNIAAVEFYDMERVEILRGPQGTLYGKNATGGAINFVTRKPDFEGISGYVDLEAADYSNTRVKGAFNLPITDNFALRFAGLKLDRDGYTENLADGQVGLDGRTLEDIDDDVDGRDILDLRITALWDINDRAEAWVIYNRFDENDDRSRITNQVCVTGPIPTYGCIPGAVGFEQPHASAQFGNLVAGLYSLVPLGTPDLTGNFNWPRPNDQIGLRKMHTDFEPVFENEQNTFLAGFNYEFDNFDLGIVGGYYDFEYFTRQDYNMNVGAELAPNFYRVDGLYPISDTAGRAGDEWRSGPCNAFDGTSGVRGGCVFLDDLTRTFTFDQGDSDGDGWTVEAKVRSSLEGRFNFLLGASTFDGDSTGDYYVNANMLDARPDFYPGFFNATGDPDGATFGEGWAVFGEGYFDITDRLKLTVGVRYNEDEKSVRDTSLLWNAQDVRFTPCFTFMDFGDCSLAAFGGTAEPLFTRVFDFLTNDPDGVPDSELALIEFYGQGDALAAALLTGAQSPERLAISSAIPIVPDFNEQRALTGSPDVFEWKEFTGRIGLDWRFNDNAMVYAFYSRGYKPGGANPPIQLQFQSDSNFDFEQEDIDSFEVGIKSTLLDGRMVLNGTFFVYDYAGLQVARIKNNTSVNENIDADIMGAEVELFWRPEFAEGLAIDASYSWLDTEVTNSESVDPLDRTGGDPDFITLNDFAFLYAARKSTLDPVIPSLIGFGCAVVPGGPTSISATATPGVLYPDGTPAIISRSCADAFGVETVEGIPFDLDGNSLPNSPENTIHLGIAYTWGIPAIAGSLTGRWDYYWQDDSFAREFNARGDDIDSWDQHNASLIYDSSNGKWTVRAWIRNIGDEDNVTGHYVTSDTSGYFRNYQLTEPRIYGASLRYNFGS
ncbi:MAG: TonB-dependent receptor [Gammaproteobacteria bacterium]|nr:TonB-dependent receptor [Gammaproteobacteria bacterium]